MKLSTGIFITNFLIKFFHTTINQAVSYCPTFECIFREKHHQEEFSEIDSGWFVFQVPGGTKEAKRKFRSENVQKRGEKGNKG